MKTTLKLITLLFIGGIFGSCGKDNMSYVERINKEIFEVMEEVYLWNENLPRNVDPGAYDNPADYMEALRYDLYDKWSSVFPREEFEDYFVTGQMIGHGFLIGLDESENLRIAFVYRNTETANKGVKRGWILSKVNGTTVTQSNFGTVMGESRVGVKNTISFINENGQTVDLELTKGVIALTPVLHSEVIEQGTDKIGYMVFQDFIETAIPEIDSVFNSFKDAGITDLIIDMRYNGGGIVTVAEHIAGWLIGKDYSGEPFTYFETNAILSEPPYDKDTVYTVPVNEAGFSFDRIFFIGTDGTASASELIINGIDPFLPVILAGSTTHGKPVGMYSIPIPQNRIDFTHYALPVCFKYSNKNHSGEFYNGIPADIPADDDITRNFGDPEEASLKAILNYIETGTLAGQSTKSTVGNSHIIIRKGPMGQYLRAF